MSDKKSLRVAIYARTKEYLMEGNCQIEKQIEIVEKFINDKKWKIYKIYKDLGTNENNRPNFVNMLLDAQNGKFDVIICSSVDRFTRNFELFKKYVYSKFPLWKIRFMAVKANYDSESKIIRELRRATKKKSTR